MAETIPQERRPRLVTGAFVAVTGATLAFFVYVGMLVATVPRFVENELGAGEVGVGLTVTAFAAAAIAVRPLIGWAGDRFGRRRMMMVGALIAALAGVSMAAVDTLWQLLILRAFTGVGEAALFVGGASLIADLAPPNRRAEAASYFSVAVFGGIGLGPAIAEVMLDAWGYAPVFAVAGLVAAGAAALVVAIPRRVDPIRPDADGVGVVLFHRAALWPGLVLASGIAGYTALGAFMPEYSREVGLSGAAALFATYSVVSVVLRLSAATLPERLGAGRTVTFALVLLSVGLLVAAGLPSATGLWLAVVVIATGMAFMYPSLMAIVVNGVGDAERSRALASFTMFFEAGSVVGGLTLGTVAELLGKRAAFAAGTVMAMIGLVILWTRVVPATQGVRPDRGHGVIAHAAVGPQPDVLRAVDADAP